MSNKKTDILFLCPLTGIGGIVSWGLQYLNNPLDEEFKLCPINIAPSKDFTLFHRYDRLLYGIIAFFRTLLELRSFFRKNPQIRLMHIATSGGLGVYRDYWLGRYCKTNGLKSILHCHFGTIKALYDNKSRKARYFRKVLHLYDQIWVLDRQSAVYLSSKVELKNKIFLTPNSIEVPETCDFRPKCYKRIGYVGNLLSSKGIFELLEAVLQLNNGTELVFVGEGTKDVKDRIKAFAKDKYGKSIRFLGRLPNEEAVRFIDSIDILALPTYYWGEAFPISILEAMSRGKLVISCPRAAIPDMLTSTDGTLCGILVQERSPQAIVDAIKWCQTHSREADEMCRKAYEKVKNKYRQEVVYDLYKTNYKLALQ